MTSTDVIADHRAAGRAFTAAGMTGFVREAGDGETVLCMHGVPRSSFLYRKVLDDELAACDLRGVAFDLPGLGLARLRGVADRSAVPNANSTRMSTCSSSRTRGRAFLKIMRGFDRTAVKRDLYGSVLARDRYPVQVIGGTSGPALNVDIHARQPAAPRAWPRSTALQASTSSRRTRLPRSLISWPPSPRTERCAAPHATRARTTSEG